jgi:hypothetical protein
MLHEFMHVGSNAHLSSHECAVCGLVVSLAKSQPSSSLPLEGCCLRNYVETRGGHPENAQERKAG